MVSRLMLRNLGPYAQMRLLQTEAEYFLKQIIALHFPILS